MVPSSTLIASNGLIVDSKKLLKICEQTIDKAQKVLYNIYIKIR